jgi:hypothetical protein
MAAFLLATPFILAYHTLPSAGEDRVLACLAGYLAILLALQALGTLRAYASWRVRVTRA